MKNTKAKRAGIVAQVIEQTQGPEFKPQYHWKNNIYVAM
jgi:hypothetical protein